MSSNVNNAESKPVRRSGGLYSKINMSVRAANIMVASLIVILIAATAFIVRHGGFTVNFDTDGGTSISSVKLKYSDKIPISDVPTKEGYNFTGWYKDRDCTERWNVESDTVSNSTTLYAGWELREK